MLKSIFSRILWTAFVLASVQATSLMAETCSNATLKGTYLYVFQGHLVGTSGTPTPFSVSGMEVFEGNGKSHGVSTTTTIVNGQTVIQSQVPYTGLYTINSDCSGSEVDTDVNHNLFHYTLNVGPSGTSEVFTETDPGVVAAGLETRDPGREGQQEATNNNTEH